MQLEHIEHVYMEKSRRVHELRQAQAGENTAEAMLKVLRIETQRNKDSEARLLREKDEKLQRLQQLEISLQEPMVNQQSVMEMQVGADGQPAVGHGDASRGWSTSRRSWRCK